MGYIYLTIFTVAGLASSLLFKAGMLRVGQFPQNRRKLPRFFLRTFSNPLVILASLFFIVFVVFYSFALSTLPLSYIRPLGEGIPVVVTAIFSSLLFKEKVGRLSWLGISIIGVGVIIVGVFQT